MTRSKTKRTNWFSLAGIMGIALLALVLRLHAIGFGLPAILDPDELIFLLGSLRMVDSGTMNPGWFGHPATTTMYVLVTTNLMVFANGSLMGDFASADEFAQAVFFDPGLVLLPGRIAMLLFALASVILTYRLASRLAGNTAGLFAAAMMACNPIHIAWSQVVRSDIMATTFLLLTMLVSIRLVSNPRRRDFALACLCTALAVTSKWPFVLAFLSIIGACGLRVIAGEKSLWDCVKTLAICGVLTCVFIVVISPHLVFDYETLLSNLQGEAQSSHLGATGDGLFANIWSYLSDPLWRALGPVGAVLAVAGLVAARKNGAFWAIAGIPALAMLLLISAQTLVWERWAIALFPAASIAAGIAVAAIAKAAPVHPNVRNAGIGVITLAVLLPLILTSYSAATERGNDNRRQATDWARDNLPSDAVLMVEHFAFDLIDSEFQVVFPIGTGGCFDTRSVLAGRIDYQQIDSLRGGNSNLDFAAVPDEQLESCKTDFAILTEYARYEAEKANFPIAHARYKRIIESGRVMQRFPAIEGRVGGRPEVMVLDLREAAPASE